MDALDVDFRISSDGECIGCRVWVCLGGPNVWLDTENAIFYGAWGCEKYALPITHDVAEVVREYAWECRGWFIEY